MIVNTAFDMMPVLFHPTVFLCSDAQAQEYSAVNQNCYNYDRDKYPEFQEIIEEAEDTIETWKKEQVIVRKNTRGLIWDLEVNHGCGKQSKNPDDEGGQKHGVVVLPAINELTPPDDEDESHG